MLAIKIDPVSEPFFNPFAEQQLNGLGAEGWEVAGVTSERSATGRTVTFVLKRKKSSPNQVACCQGVILDDQAGSNGARFLSAP